MKTVEYHTTDRQRICRICAGKIVKHTWAIVMRNIHVSPKFVDLHFHEGCLMRSLDAAKKEYSKQTTGAEG